MKKKIFIQIFLILIILLIVFIIYQKYFKKKFSTEKPVRLEQTIVDEKNIINNITYESTDNKGRRYIITSKTGTLDEKNPELISMVQVDAKIILMDKSVININSLRAEYNNITNDTKFFDDINLEYLDHKMFCNNLNVLFKDNLLEAYNDLTYENSDIIMLADKIEMDLLTKNSKIFKFGDNKVKIETKN